VAEGGKIADDCVYRGGFVDEDGSCTVVGDSSSETTYGGGSYEGDYSTSKNDILWFSFISFLMSAGAFEVYNQFVRNTDHGSYYFGMLVSMQLTWLGTWFTGLWAYLSKGNHAMDVFW